MCGDAGERLHPFQEVLPSITNGSDTRFPLRRTTDLSQYILTLSYPTSSGEPEGCIWIDDIQLDPGSAATAFTQAPVAAQLVSAARGNFLPFGQAPDFNLMIQSLPNAAGTVSLSVEDFFFKPIFSKTYSFTTDPTGHSTLVLDDLSSKLFG